MTTTPTPLSDESLSAEHVGAELADVLDLIDLPIEGAAPETESEEGAPEYDRAAHLDKLANYLRSLTPEQRAEMRLKAEQTRQRKREFAEANYRMDWADEKLWKVLAKLAGVQLAAQYQEPTAYKLASFARQIGLDSWKEALFGSIASKGVNAALRYEFELAQPGKRLNLRAYQGTLLECKYGAHFRKHLSGQDIAVLDSDDDQNEE